MISKSKLIQIAKSKGAQIKPAMNKRSIIWAIQASEENNPCFASEYCDNDGCLWFSECLKYHTKVRAK